MNAKTKWYICTIKYYSAIKRNKVLIDAMTQINLETWCKVKESSHNRPHIACSCFYEMSRTGKSMETESSSVVALGWGKGAGEWLLIGKGFLVGVMKIFWNYPVMTAVQPCGYISNHNLKGLILWHVNYISIFKTAFITICKNTTWIFAKVSFTTSLKCKSIIMSRFDSQPTLLKNVPSNT